MSNPTLDAGIPVLTEIIPAPTALAAHPPETDVPALVDDNLATPDLQPPLVRDEAEWERLEREVRERVLVQILERVDFVLEQRVRDSLADALQVAVERLATEIREGLHSSIKNIVKRAVTQEITKLQVSKK